jgi:replication fork clamp-binding protein CrfC
MTKLNLTPNELVGYRIHPDQYNWTVVAVKRHGPTSKNAGQEYETPLSYPKDIQGAIRFIVKHVAAIEGDQAQNHVFETTGVTASLEALQSAFEKAEKSALDAVADLETRLKASGLDFASLKKRDLMKEVEEVEE